MRPDSMPKGAEPGTPAADATPGAGSKPDSVNETAGRPSKGSKATGDRELVQRVQNGDETAFRELFEKYHRRVFAVALGVVKNKQDAMDIVQDGFIKAHRHIGSFQGSSSFYTWLYRIVMNLAIDHVRRAKRGRHMDYDDSLGREADDVAGDGALLPHLLDGNPQKTVLRRELTEAIQAALVELPEYHRAVIMMREVEGLSYEEMSEVLEVPKGTIMSRLFHARKKMQATLSEYLQGEIRIEGDR